MSYRNRKLKSELGSFLRAYARKKRKNGDPNDRHYSRKLEQQIKKMRPEELDRMLRDEDESDLEQ